MKITDAKQPDVQCNNNSNIALINANFLKRIETIKDFSLENELSQSFDIPHPACAKHDKEKHPKPGVSTWI